MKTVFDPRDVREAADFISKCENRFTESVFSVADDIALHGSCRAVALAGPSCAGKTSTADRLKTELERCGKHVKIISIDDFFHDCEHTVVRPDGRPDYDTVRAIDLPLLEKCISDLLAGRTAYLPHFNFKTHIRDRIDEYVPRENDIYVMEGIQALYPEITSLFSPETLVRVFLSPDGERSVNGIELHSRDVRLMRRLYRDFHSRSTSLDSTYRIWPDVCENENLNIFPYVDGCDYIIDTFMEYELHMMSRCLLPLLKAMPDGSDFADETQRLIRILENFYNSPVSSDLLPDNSFYFEFIGK